MAELRLDMTPSDVAVELLEESGGAGRGTFPKVTFGPVVWWPSGFGAESAKDLVAVARTLIDAAVALVAGSSETGDVADVTSVAATIKLLEPILGSQLERSEIDKAADDDIPF